MVLEIKREGAFKREEPAMFQIKTKEKTVKKGQAETLTSGIAQGLGKGEKDTHPETPQKFGGMEEMRTVDSSSH